MKSLILVVEDDADCEKLTLRAIRQSEISAETRVARDGEQACVMLLDDQEPVPDLVLLDLKLPRMDGFEVLDKLRSVERTKNVPVIVFSSSNEEPDLRKAYDLRANSYVRKPVDFDTFDATLKLILFYWTTVNQRCDPLMAPRLDSGITLV
ncbi:MAG: response regulator [Fimbriimonadaceae bacterium]